MKITIQSTISAVNGYVCDVCGKKVEFESDFFPQVNALSWNHPSGGWGERDETETKDFCSMECLMELLKSIYFGANIILSSDFLNDYRDRFIKD